MENSKQLKPKIAYGIDCSDDGVVAVPMSSRVGGVSKSVMRLPHSAGLRYLAEKASNEKGVLSVPMPIKSSFTQWIEAPFASPAKARKVFDSLLDLHLPFPVDDCLYEIVEINRTADSKVEALVAGAVATSVEQRIAEINELGADPEILDHEGLALWEQAQAEFSGYADRVKVLAYLGRSRLVVVAGKGRRFEYCRSADFKTEGGLPTPDSLKRLSRRMARIFDGRSAASLIWTGSGAESPELREVVADAIGLTSSVEQLVSSVPSEFLATALARRALGRSGTNGLNCRKGAVTHPRISEFIRRRKYMFAVSALASVIAVCAINAAVRSGLNSAQKQADEAVASMAMDVADLSRVPRGQELEVVRQTLESGRSGFERISDFFSDSAGMHLLALVDTALGYDMHLDSVSIRDGELSIRGSAIDWDDSDRLANLARQIGFEVELERADAGADERVHFTIHGEAR